MKLSPNGRNRLDAMKRALAAGLPLAGLLAAACSEAPQEKAPAQSKHNWVYLGKAEDALELDPLPMGDLIPDDPAGEPAGPPDELQNDTADLCIAADVLTVGVLLPPKALQPLHLPENWPPSEKALQPPENWPPCEDVVIRIEDAEPPEEAAP